MKISDLKPGQKVTINRISYEYLGIQKVRIPNIGEAEKGCSKQLVLIPTNTTISLMETKH